MGIIKDGINGPFRGKAGSVIGSSWRKVNYVKGLARFKTKRKASAEQQLERKKFALLNHFFDPISGILEIGFRRFTDRATGRNKAVSYNYEWAFTINGSEVTLNYPKLQLSYGALFPAGDERAWLEGNRLHVTWDPETYGMGRSMEDIAFLVYYDEVHELFARHGQTRRYEGGVTIMDTLFGLRPLKSHVWLFFLDEAAKQVSKTVYIPVEEDVNGEN